MRLIALTGGICSGKSSVLKYILDHYEINYFDCDEEAHRLLEKDKIVRKKIINEFSKSILTKRKIDRKKLGQIVFSDKSKLAKLNSIIHPIIKRKIEELKANTIVDIPLLFESNFSSLFDYIILVYVSKSEQLNRLIKRDNFTKTEAMKRIESQINLEDKIKLSDFVIDNTGDFQDTIKQVNAVLAKILEV